MRGEKEILNFDPGYSGGKFWISAICFFSTGLSFPYLKVFSNKVDLKSAIKNPKFSLTVLIIQYPR
jgi:hypothetical protein